MSLFISLRRLVICVVRFVDSELIERIMNCVVTVIMPTKAAAKMPSAAHN